MRGGKTLSEFYGSENGLGSEFSILLKKTSFLKSWTFDNLRPFCTTDGYFIQVQKIIQNHVNIVHAWNIEKDEINEYGQSSMVLIGF